MHALSKEELISVTSALERKFGAICKLKKVFDGLFDQQRDFIKDKDRFKAAVCTRRAGKTHTAAFYLLKEAMLTPNANCVYLGVDRMSAKRNMWGRLQLMISQMGFEIKAGSRDSTVGVGFLENIVFRNGSNLTLSFPNGSEIFLSGAGARDEIEKFRGAAYRLVVLDEAASFRSHITEMIQEVFTPALIDMKGSIVIIGTPSSSCAGFFHEKTNTINNPWSTHKWSMLDNPYIDDAKGEMEIIKEQYGWNDDHPACRRELYAEWVRSDDSMVYAWDADRNGLAELPTGDELKYVVGVDLGYEDATAFVVGAFSPHDKNFYVVDCWQKTGMIPGDIAVALRTIIDKWKPISVVADTGGLGKSIVEEFKQRYRINVSAAEKTNKYEYIELMNSDFHSGFIKANPASEVVSCWRILQWDPVSKSGLRREDDRFDNHLSDAALYCWRDSRHYRYKRKKVIPEKGTKEYNQYVRGKQIERITQKAKERSKKKKLYGIRG